MSDVTKEELIEWFGLEPDKLAKIEQYDLDELNGELEDARMQVFRDWFYKNDLNEF